MEKETGRTWDSEYPNLIFLVPRSQQEDKAVLCTPLLALSLWPWSAVHPTRAELNWVTQMTALRGPELFLLNPMWIWLSFWCRKFLTKDNNPTMECFFPTHEERATSRNSLPLATPTSLFCMRLWGKGSNICSSINSSISLFFLRVSCLQEADPLLCSFLLYFGGAPPHPTMGHSVVAKCHLWVSKSEVQYMEVHCCHVPKPYFPIFNVYKVVFSHHGPTSLTSFLIQSFPSESDTSCGQPHILLVSLSPQPHCSSQLCVSIPWQQFTSLDLSLTLRHRAFQILQLWMPKKSFLALMLAWHWHTPCPHICTTRICKGVINNTPWPTQEQGLVDKHFVLTGAQFQGIYYIDLKTFPNEIKTLLLPVMNFSRSHCWTGFLSITGSVSTLHYHSLESPSRNELSACKPMCQALLTGGNLD